MRIEEIFKLRHRYLKECRALQSKFMLAEIGKKKQATSTGGKNPQLLTNLSNPAPTFIDHDEDEFSPEAIFGI